MNTLLKDIVGGMNPPENMQTSNIHGGIICCIIISVILALFVIGIIYLHKNKKN